MHQDFARQLAAHHADLLHAEAAQARRVRQARRLLRRHPSPGTSPRPSLRPRPAA